MAYDANRPDQPVGQLNSLLRGEISARETYQQAISKFGTEGRGDVEVLREIALEHGDAVQRLSDAVRDAGGT
ncbi:MAG: hypothetical protein ACT4R6_11805, partial [Gemmatimonadaceae bacterium]